MVTKSIWLCDLHTPNNVRVTVTFPGGVCKLCGGPASNSADIEQYEEPKYRRPRHEDVGTDAVVVAYYGPGGERGRGKIVAMSYEPMVSIEQADGTRFWWTIGLCGVKED